MKNLSKAITNVIKSVHGVEKGATVGEGRNAYKAVSDYDVKKVIRVAMADNGLCLIPVSIEPEATVSNWETTYNGTTQRKQQVFTTVKTKYLLLHESGESIEVAGYGHGVDSQDKAAGKASTYALKYALLYLFLVPVGVIDDSEETHSDDIETPGHPEKEALKPVKTFDKAEFEKIKETITAAKAKGYGYNKIWNAISKKGFDSITAEAKTLIDTLKI